MNAPQKVLLLIPSLRGGGSERVFSILLQHLDRNRFEPHLAVLEASGEYLKDIPQDVVVHDFQCGRARYSLLHIVRLVRKLEPKAVLSTLSCNVALMMVKYLLPRTTKLILSEAALPSAAFNEQAYSPEIWRWLYRLFYRQADKVICLSRSMADEMLRDFKVPGSKVICIYNPVDFRRIRELSEKGPNPFNASGPHLVAAGRLCTQKGFDVLLAAMPAVRRTFPEAQLAILGQGPLQQELERQAQALELNNALHLWGFQENPWRFVKHADVFVLSSRWEGLPNILLEAMALGKRIVATDCPGAISEIQGYIPTMRLVPLENPEALAEAIVSACNSLCHSQAANGMEEPTEASMAAFGVENIVEQYSELFLS